MGIAYSRVQGGYIPCAGRLYFWCRVITLVKGGYILEVGKVMSACCRKIISSLQGDYIPGAGR